MRSAPLAVSVRVARSALTSASAPEIVSLFVPAPVRTPPPPAPVVTADKTPCASDSVTVTEAPLFGSAMLTPPTAFAAPLTTATEAGAVMTGGGVGVSTSPDIVKVSTGSAAPVVASVGVSVIVSLKAPATPLLSRTVGAKLACPGATLVKAPKPEFTNSAVAGYRETAGQRIRRRDGAVEHAQRDRGRGGDDAEVERIGGALLRERPSARDLLELSRRRDFVRGDEDGDGDEAEIGDAEPVDAGSVGFDVERDRAHLAGRGRREIDGECRGVCPRRCRRSSRPRSPRPSCRRRWRSASRNSRRWDRCW